MEYLLTPNQAAKIIAVAPRTIKDWLRRGELTGVKVRNMWRIRESDLKQFIQEGVQEASNSVRRNNLKYAEIRGVGDEG